MDFPKIHESEYRFCLIMWEHEPVTAVELVKLCHIEIALGLERQHQLRQGPGRTAGRVGDDEFAGGLDGIHEEVPWTARGSVVRWQCTGRQ